MLLKPQAWGRRYTAHGQICWTCSSSLQHQPGCHLHWNCRPPGSSGWVLVGVEKFTGLGFVLSKALQRHGNSHARGTSRHAEKTNNLWSKAHGGVYFPEVLYHFYAQIERCRTEEKILFQNLSVKIHVPSGHKPATSSRHRCSLGAGCLASHHCQGSCLPHCAVQWQAGDGTRLPV